MPLYEFVCKKCKHVMEKLVFNEDEENALRCVKCGKKVAKQMSTFSFEVNGFNAANRYSKEKK